MKRRRFLTYTGYAAGLLSIPGPIGTLVSCTGQQGEFPHIGLLKDEPPVQAEIRSERGRPRLFVNGQEADPFLAMSRQLLHTIDNYREGDIRFIVPFLGMRSGWHGPDRYDWTVIDSFLDRLLERYPGAYFLPRLHLNTPDWWKEAHPDQMIKYARPLREKRYKIRDLTMTDGGHSFDLNKELWEASFASKLWREDTGRMLQDYLRHVQNSPLRSRMIGYHFTTGRTAEWNCFGPALLPDTSPPMREACGKIPAVEDRTHTRRGLLRDPDQERRVIDYYRCFHEEIARTVCSLASDMREVTRGETLTGVYFGYVMEQVQVQEGGYLDTERVMTCDDIDYIASPYTYQGNNFDGDDDRPAGMVDGAGNWLGRGRGVGGDGGYRVPVESLRRHGKLFIVEIDPSTYLNDKLLGIGGPGSDTEEGTVKIFQRDLGQMWSTGVGGWLYDFGPMHGVQEGWYDAEPVINEMRRFSEYGELRPNLNFGSVAEIAVVTDLAHFTYTQHWLQERPWDNYGIGYCDFFNHWFLNTQSRAIHRIGAPTDFLYQFDFHHEDPGRYPLILMCNAFLLTADDVKRYREYLSGSGATVVWYYAPGYIAPDGLDLSRMEALTGFQFQVRESPGSFMIRLEEDTFPDSVPTRFGVDADRYPRFSVTGNEGESLGYWEDQQEVAFARKSMDGWTSVYVGTGPLPAELLRWLGRKAGISLWSSKPQIVWGTEDTAMVVATEDGPCELSFLKPLRDMQTGQVANKHTLDLTFGDVRLFIREDGQS